ncbi:hypothetical protein PoB_002344900 [Plakobranchus ocellatus]|uniref:Uncharacterized protein n=1 Tax=Plakobranchus ocellatus TaxID=259542 RepID=A0AAV3ZNQ3_9GAST|nr:hypothetical protein PoB_002344900 [Plakobranchus ocellatus]
MNYLFYVGIILPTLITICLFLIFIYCWFLQKARKEVLTRRYDPHGKMRKLGMSMEPPPPPDFCRLEATAATPLAAHLSPGHYGEDNMAYCVSRSPSTDQQQQQQQQQHSTNQPARRSLYHTYHDSGISTGGLAALTNSTTEGSQRDVHDPDSRSHGRVSGAGAAVGGLSYRTCPDSGISGLSGGFYVAGDSAGLGAACQQSSCHTHDSVHQIYHEDQCRHQSQQQSLYHHQQQQQQQTPRHHLHHTLVPASVHPSHGVCYGDNTNHPQSPQHYGPPPQYHQLQQQHYPHHEISGPQMLQGDNTAQHFQQLQMTAQIHSQPSTVPKDLPTPCSSRRCGNDNQIFELVSPTVTRSKDFRGQNDTTETSFGPQGALDIMVTASSDPRIANISLPNQHSLVLSCLMQQEQQQSKQQEKLQHLDCPTSHHQHHAQLHQQQHNPLSHTTTTLPSLKANVSSGSKMPHSTRLRDSDVTEDPGGSAGSTSSSNSSTDQSSVNINNNTTINSNTTSDRPDSQASHSPSTTDSEDSGFRGSHCPNPAPPVAAPAAPSSRLNKQANPLLKPLRRPRNKASRKNARGQAGSSPNDAKTNGHTPNIASPQRNVATVANTDSSAPGSPTPLITLDPQNLSPTVISDMASMANGLEMMELVGRGGPTSMRTPDSSPHHSPSTYPYDGGPPNTTDNVNGSVALGDISTHLSWSYLQSLSSGHTEEAGVVPTSGRVGGGTGGGTRQLRHDLHQMDILGYSVV